MQMKWASPLCRYCWSNWILSVPLCAYFSAARVGAWVGSGRRVRINSPASLQLVLSDDKNCCWLFLYLILLLPSFAFGKKAATFEEIIECISRISQNPSGNYILKCVESAEELTNSGSRKKQTWAVCCCYLTGIVKTSRSGFWEKNSKYKKKKQNKQT